jgi:hypothetical protein
MYGEWDDEMREHVRKHAEWDKDVVADVSAGEVRSQVLEKVQNKNLNNTTFNASLRNNTTITRHSRRHTFLLLFKVCVEEV